LRDDRNSLHVYMSYSSRDGNARRLHVYMLRYLAGNIRVHTAETPVCAD
jgi:hypothetical protein